ncbi:MAG TPA: metal ABC transporter ATP-binding protein [Dehalococcoidia bacterium]|jgi:manganese/zinc/iron transport system ATP- binding protein|nr:metal ABC transporter ATP-binding protein [Dehalococcoidia bacterium]
MIATTPVTVDHENCLVIRDLTVAYGRKVVLEGVQADIRRGQVVGVVGPNGGGKSTLLKAILGIVPAVSGSVMLFGKPADKCRSRIAYVPQREEVDWEFPVTVHDVVMMGRYPHTGWLRRNTANDRRIADEVLRQVDMAEYSGQQIGQLSGGQQQRVFIARALAQEGDVLLLDEPMSGIDASTQDIILRVIEEQSQAGKIILLATHDLVSASCACDCLCCVNERMVSYGPLAETYTSENLAATYGGPVIMLGRAGAPVPAHTHHTGDHTHHHLPGPERT